MSRSGWAVCLVVAVMAAFLPAAAGPDSPTVRWIRFETLPRDCTAVLLGRDGIARPLTAEGRAVAVDLAGEPGAEKLRFELLRPGCKSRVEEVPRAYLEAPAPGGIHRWPPQPMVFLTLPPVIVEATFFTRPSGVSLWLVRSDGGQEYLGTSGEPLQLSLAGLMGQPGYFRVRLEREGYHPEVVPVPNHTFGEGKLNRWPAQGAYPLQPALPILVPVRTAIQDHPRAAALVGMGVALALVLAAAPLGRLRRELRRARRIQQLLATAQDDADPRVGSRLGAYRILARLGEGGMATVYRAVNEERLDPDEACALKVLRPDLCRDRYFVGRFRREVRTLMQLTHPRIVRLDDWGEQDGLVYLVTELMEGRSLRQVVVPGGLPMEDALRFLDAILEGMAHAHRHGVIHRDLKPENVLLDGRGQVKIADFGLAGRSDEENTPLGLGTPGYMAPEQFLGLPQDARTDQYALGVLAYELLTGRRPFAETAASRPRAHVGEEPPPLTRLRPLPRELADLVHRMLAPDPQRRFPSLDGLRRELARIGTAPGGSGEGSS